MRHTAEASPPRRPGHAKLATSGRIGTPVCAAAALTPQTGWAARRCSGSPSARQRAHTGAYQRLGGPLLGHGAAVGVGGPASLWTSVAGTARAGQARSRLVHRAVSCAPSGGLAPPDPSHTEAGCCSSGLLLAGLCATDRDAVEGFPWPGRPRGWAQLGSRSPGLHLAAAVLSAWGRRNVRSARSCVKARLLPLRFSRALRAALTPAPSAWASPRKQEEQNLQRPAAYRPGERRARFSPPPLETQRPWEAKLPLRVAAAHSPQKHSSEQACFFCF